jgi:hypothetical protein
LHTDKFIDSNKIAEFVTHIHLAERIMAEFWGHFSIRENGTGQQLAQFHDIYEDNDDNLLYTDRVNICVYLYYTIKKRCTLWKWAIAHQVLPRDFLNHEHNCQCISQQQGTEISLHICDIDINEWVNDFRDIFAYFQFNAMNKPVLILHINPCMYCVIYEVITLFQVRVSFDSKKKKSMFLKTPSHSSHSTSLSIYLSKLRQYYKDSLLKISKNFRKMW